MNLDAIRGNQNLPLSGWIRTVETRDGRGAHGTAFQLPGHAQQNPAASEPAVCTNQSAAVKRRTDNPLSRWLIYVRPKILREYFRRRRKETVR